MQQIWLHACCRPVPCFIGKDMRGQSGTMLISCSQWNVTQPESAGCWEPDLRSSASHSQCVEMWRWWWRQAAGHHAEEQAAARANYWSQQIKEVYPDNVTFHFLLFFFSFFLLVNILQLVFVKWKCFNVTGFLIQKHFHRIFHHKQRKVRNI